MSAYIFIIIVMLVLIGALVGAYFYFKNIKELEESEEETKVDFEKEFATCKTEKEASVTASKLLQEKIDEKEKELLAEKERCEKAVEEGVSTETQAKADLQEKIDAATKELDAVKEELQKHVALAEIRKNLASCGYKLTEDGRLVIHDKDGKEVWSTPKPTTGTGPFKLVAQDDGNLIIYDKNNKAVWASGTILNSIYRKAPYKLVLEEDCRLVLVGSDNIGIWRSPQPVSPATAVQAGISTVANALSLSECKETTCPASLVSKNGKYTLDMQTDGNLVVYDVSVNPRKAMWWTRTYNIGEGPYKLVMKSDGNLVIYGNNKAIWSSNSGPSTNRKNPYNLVLQDDGNLVIYGSDHVAIWSTSRPGAASIITQSVTQPIQTAATAVQAGIAAKPVVEKFSQLMLKLAPHPGNTQLAYSSFKEISNQPVL